MTLEYQNPATRVPLSEKINFRLVLLIGIVALIIGYPIYVLIDSQITGGIKDVGGGYKEVDLKAMSTFTLDQNDGTINDIPEKWRALDGKPVVLYGEIWQPYSASNEVAGFDLCYSIAKCCFNGPPLVQHFVKSHVKSGKSVQIYDGRVRVVGTLHVNVIKDTGKLVSIYQLDVDSVDPAT